MIFYRHRPRLVDHAEACLRSNMTRRSVVSEVEDLVLGCAVPRRQIDYIVGAAEARLAKEPDFHSTLLDEIRLHKQRMKSIQELHDDPEIVDELLEIEQARHSNAVQRLSGVEGGGMPGGF